MKRIIIFTLAFFVSAIYTEAQWHVDTLSAPSYNLTVTQNGTKALFTSGARFDIYDFVSNTWTTKNITQTRGSIKAATAGSKSYFAGGGIIGVYSQVVYKNIDIYNNQGNTWTTANLSQARIVGAAASVGNKVFFAGGRQVLAYSNRVDIFDITTGVRTTHKLSQARHNMGVAVVGSKVIFAGGECGNISMGTYTTSNKVDIYDDATGIWSTAQLSVKREQMTVAIVGNKVLFAGGLNNSGNGGQYLKSVDVYDVANNSWSVMNMSEAKYGISAAVTGTKVYLAGGSINGSGALTNRVEVFDAATNLWSYTTLSAQRMNMCSGITSNRIMFAGGITTWGNVGSDRIEVLDLATNTWSVEYLSQPRFGITSAAYNNTVLFAGGAQVLSGYPQYTIVSNKVDIYTQPVPKSQTETTKSYKISVYPNPVSDYLNYNLNPDKLSSIERPEMIAIYDNSGRNIFEDVKPQSHIDVNFLKPGIYIIEMQKGDKKYISKFIKN